MDRAAYLLQLAEVLPTCPDVSTKAKRAFKGAERKLNRRFCRECDMVLLNASECRVCGTSAPRKKAVEDSRAAAPPVDTAWSELVSKAKLSSSKRPLTLIERKEASKKAKRSSLGKASELLKR